VEKMSILLGSILFFSSQVFGASDYHLWLLDEGQGAAAVDSGSRGVDLKLVSPAWSPEGPVGQARALRFDGTGKTYAVQETAIAVNTIEMWIRPRKLTGGQTLFSTKYTSTSRIMFALGDGNLIGREEWWSQNQGVTAEKAFTAADIGKWSHVAFTMGSKGYRLYKNGKLMAQKAGSPYSSQSDRIAIGINSWELKGGGFDGDIAQVRLTAAELEPGKGPGKDELAWAGSLTFAKVVRPSLEWLGAAREGNLFIREEKPVLTLRVFNRFYEDLPAMKIIVGRKDQYTGQELSPIELNVAEPIKGRQEKRIPVDMGITQASVYTVTAKGPVGSEGTTSVTWVRGPQPEEPCGPVPFFGNSSHAGFAREDWLLRREFGSRAERGSLVMWQGTPKPGKIEWPKADQDVVTNLAVPLGSQVFGYTGYTPAFASPMPEGKKDIHDLPIFSQYVDWVQQAARHYKGFIKYWEIWNEPNGMGVFLNGSAEHVADLHKAGFLAVKRVDPCLKVVGASLVSVDPEFMDRLYDSGAVDYMDVIAFHNYQWGYPPDYSIVSQLQTMIAWRDKYAPNRALWNDEWGEALAKQSQEPARYAQSTARQLILDRALGIQHSDVYTWDGHEYRLWFGRQATPAAIAYRTVAQFLTNVTPAAAISEGSNGVFAYAFKNKEGLVLAAWNIDDGRTDRLENIPVNPGKAALYDLMGNPCPINIQEGKVSLPLSKGPVFLEGVLPSYLENGLPLKASPDGLTPVRHPSLWYSYHYPAGTEVLGLVWGESREIVLRVYNDGGNASTGELNLASPDGALTLSASRLAVSLPPHTMKEVCVKVQPVGKPREGVYRISIHGRADGMNFGNMKIRCYVAEGETTLFHMNTWEVMAHQVSSDKIDQWIHACIVMSGGHLKFKFDLKNARLAKLARQMNPYSSAVQNDGQFRISASLDDRKWDVLHEGQDAMAWWEIDLSAYAGKEVFIRFDNPTAKTSSVIRQFKLTTVSKTKK
jgi:hypothetical protein